MHNFGQAATVNENVAVSNSSAEPNSGSLKRARAMSDATYEGPMDCKRQRSDDGEPTTNQCCTSPSVAKRKRGESLGQDELADLFKKVKMGEHQPVIAQPKKQNNSRGSLHGVKEDTKSGEYYKAWILSHLDRSDLHEEDERTRCRYIA